MTKMIKTKMIMANMAETDQGDLVWRHQYELHIYCDEDDGDDYDGEDNNGMMM